MKKRNLLTTLICSSVIFFNYPAQAKNVTQFIIEKKIDADRKTGFILASDIEALRRIPSQRKTVVASVPIKTNKKSNAQQKSYSILNDSDSYNSLIVVKDNSGNEIKRISVGRQAMKLITSRSGKIFVLCGGYFGSVWEIDPARDAVVRKFVTSWSPTDMALDPLEKFLYVTSGKLQKFSLESDIVMEIKVPDDLRYMTSVNAFDKNSLIVSGLDKNEDIKNFLISGNDTELKPATNVTRFVPSVARTVKINNTQAGDNSISMIYSQSNDYVYVFSNDKGSISALIPLDAKADQILSAPELNKAYVLHRSIAQVSVIDLSRDTTTRNSVIARVMDDRLNEPTNTMVLEGNKVFIKSDFGQEGYIDTDNILRFTSPVVDIPMNKEKEVFAVSLLANKRFYLRNNQLFYEEINDSSTQITRKIRIDTFGNTVGGIAVTSDGKTLYVSDYSNNTITAVDTITNRETARFSVGSEPADIVLAGDQQRLFVLSKGDRTISTLNLTNGQVSGVQRLKVENTSLNQVKIYDNKFDQMVKVNLTSDLSKDLVLIRVR